MLVYPRGPLLGGRLLSRARDRTQPIQNSSRRAGSSHDLRRLRPYQQGEDIRFVHWPTSARGRELMVREFQDPGGRSLCLILDNRAEFGDYPHTTLEEAVKAAAALTHYAHRHQLPLTVAGIFDGQWLSVRQPRLEQVLELLARARREEGSLNLEQTLAGAQEVVVLTSKAEGLGALERAKARVRVLQFGDDPAGAGATRLQTAEDLAEALR